VAADVDFRERERGGGSAHEVFLAFAKLGISCFGGPIAHIGYFREEFVRRRAWLSDENFADLVALCQFLPGPASSQVGFSIGLLRGGYIGGLAAWTAFTLPSAILMVLFAYGARYLGGAAGGGLLHGLKLVAVAIVAQAVWGMARTLAPDRERASIAVVAAVIVLLSASSEAQVGAIVLGGIAGLWLGRDVAAAGTDITLKLPVSRGVGTVALILFVFLLAGLPLVHELTGAHAIAVAEAFYQSGALVFGGGHVVLPLLHETVVAPGWVSDNAFLAGYGAAQAMPGPLFTFSAYLGAVIGGVPGAALALVAIFTPGILILVGVLPFWNALRKRRGAQAIIRGVNAAVVGILGAALYNPVWSSAVGGSADFAAALLCFVLLTVWRLPPIAVVVIGAVCGIGIGYVVH
jgi:chromate transporter